MTRARLLPIGLVCALASPAHAAEPANVTVAAVDGSGAALSDVTVTLVGTDGETRVARTDAGGAARFYLPAGTFSVVATFGTRAIPRRNVTVGPGDAAEITFRFDAESAREDIRIVERLESRAAPPQVDRQTVRRELPYSDEAIAQNVWASVWLVLHISADGNVERAEVLKSQSELGLDAIAIAAASKLKFRPELDRDGRPVATKILWQMEWEPFWTKRDLPPGKNLAVCAGTGPLNLDPLGVTTSNVSYHDCTPPKGYENVKLAPAFGPMSYPRPRFSRRR